MKFKDQFARCGACGKQFVYTVREQRQRAERGLPLDPPAFCPDCRGADVRLAEVSAAPSSLSGAVVPEGAAEAPRQSRAPQRPGNRGRGSAAPNVARKSAAPSRPCSRSGPTSKAAARPAVSARPKATGDTTRRLGPPRRRPSARRQTELRIRFTGNVKWFDAERGYGFIAQEEGGDVFVHSSAILGSGRATLEKGQPVEYEIERTERGLQAVDVVPLSW